MCCSSVGLPETILMLACVNQGFFSPLHYHCAQGLFFVRLPRTRQKKMNDCNNTTGPIGCQSGCWGAAPWGGCAHQHPVAMFSNILDDVERWNASLCAALFISICSSSLSTWLSVWLVPLDGLLLICQSSCAFCWWAVCLLGRQFVCLDHSLCLSVSFFLKNSLTSVHTH